MFLNTQLTDTGVRLTLPNGENAGVIKPIHSRTGKILGWRFLSPGQEANQFEVPDPVVRRTQKAAEYDALAYWEDEIDFRSELNQFAPL